MSKSATVITFNSQKGGVGKTVLSYNYGVYESSKGEKVLYIDTDYQENSTSNFNQISDKDKKNCSIYRAFLHDGKEPKKPFPKNLHPTHVGKNMDLMASDRRINNAEDYMRSHHQTAFKYYAILHLFTALDLFKKYDLIIIDTHNSMNLATVNALVVSNYVISPIIPNRYGITAIRGMADNISKKKQELLNPVTQKSLVNCKLLFVGNMVKNTTSIGKQFASAIKANKYFVASFPDRELFNKATTLYKSIFDLAKLNSKNREIVNKIIVPEFNKLEQATK